MKTVINAVNESKGVWIYDEPSIVEQISTGNLSSWRELCDHSLNKFSFRLVCNEEQFNQCVDEMSTNYGTSETYTNYKANYEMINDDMKPFPSTFTSGQEVFIAQINTLAGVSSQRYFIQQYWCDSGHQNEYVDLGLLFHNKEDAEYRCKELLGIPTETDEERAVEDLYEFHENNRKRQDGFMVDLFDYIKDGKIHGVTFTGES